MAKNKDSDPNPDLNQDNAGGSGSGSAEGKQGADNIKNDDNTEGQAPAFISGLSSSEPPRPPESGDIIYMTMEEVKYNSRIHTRDTVLVPDENADYQKHNGPWIERCVGRDNDSGKLMVARIPAKERKIPPTEMLQYMGSVVKDRQAVHTASVVYPGKQRNAYSFDCFYMFNNEQLPRCCWIPDRIHMAGLLFEKMINPKTRKAFSRIRQIRAYLGRDTGEPKYSLVGGKEADYRDLKRLFERHFLKRGPEDLADDIGLKRLIGGI